VLSEARERLEPSEAAHRPQPTNRPSSFFWTQPPSCWTCGSRLHKIIHSPASVLGRQGRFHLPCEPARSTLNIIWSCGLFEGKGVSTSRVRLPGPLSISYGHVGCLKQMVLEGGAAGRVVSFDIQQVALDTTRANLQQLGLQPEQVCVLTHCSTLLVCERTAMKQLVANRNVRDSREGGRSRGRFATPADFPRRRL
jgi:hypothetical protein